MAQQATQSYTGYMQMPESGDIKTWFSKTIEVNLDSLYGVALRLTGNHANAEDLVSECVIKAWSAIDSLDDRSRFRPWIFRILNNAYISHYRKTSVRPAEVPYVEYSVHDDPDELSSWLMDQPDDFLLWWADPEHRYVNSLLGQQIMDAINELPDAFRITILLVSVEGLTYDEAAEALCVPKGTVRSRMKRGRSLLQKVLWRQAKDSGLDVEHPPRGTHDE